jgi:hypothetical protein
MPADLLRRAAAKLRAHAEAASGANWDAAGSELYAEDGGVWIGQMDATEPEATANAALAALMHPPVARALADLLQVLSWFPSQADATDLTAAYAVARAILREPEGTPDA